MDPHKLLLNLIVLFTLLLGLLASMAGLAGLAQAAPVPIGLTERSSLALPAALPPTSTVLSPNSVAENQITGTQVGTFSTDDPDPDTHTYTFTDTGSFPDNALFSIVGNALNTAAVFNFEATPSYTIRVLTTDSGNETLETTFTINVTNINEVPTELALSNNSVAENAGVNAVVGTLSAVDPDTGSSFTFDLVAGVGSSGNGAFNISGNTLRATNSLNFEAQSSYSIRVRVTDNGSPTLNREESFTITVTNVNEAPSDISLTNTRVDENQPLNTVVGTFSSTDPDNPGAGQTHTYSLVAGSGSNNNSSFNISGNQLRTNSVFDYQAKNSYSIRVRSTDNGSPATNREEVFTIRVNDVLPVISIAKTANPTSVPGTGGNVTFTVLVTNTSTEAATLNSLTDSVYGNLNGQGTCVANGTATILPNGGSYSCSFTKLISGNPGTNHVNIVTVQVSDNETNLKSANDNATVSIAPLIKLYLPVVLKNYPPTDLSVFNDNTGGNVTFTVLGTGVSCTVPNNTTQFCGSFPPGTYTVQANTVCGNLTASKIYAAGPQTTRIFCN